MGNPTDAWWFERARRFFIYSFDKPLDFIRREYRFLSYFGLRMPTSWHDHVIKRILYTIYHTAVMFVVTSFIITLSIGLYLVRDDFEKMADTLCLVAGMWMVLSKLIAYLIKQKELHKVVNIIHDLSIAEDINKYTAIRDMYILVECFVVVNFRTSSNLLFLGFVITQPPDVPIPMRAWFPFEYNYSPMKEIISVFQVVGLFLAVNLIHMVETASTVVWHQTAMQFEVLSEQLLDIDDYCLARVGENDDLDEIYEKRLNVLLMRHQYLIKLSKTLNSIFAAQSYVQVVFSNLMTCLSALGMSLSMDRQKDFFAFVIFFVVSVTQLMTWCVYGEMILNNSLKVGDSAFKCLWYERKPPFVKKLVMMIMRSQLPICMEAGLYVLTHETFVNILKNSYSCFALLNSINE